MQTDFSYAKDIRLSVNGYQLAAREWHSDASTKVIALHGWLDSSASFDVIAPLLPDSHIVALDSPGHALSDHKSPQATYNVWDDLLDILAVIDAMGWQQCHLLGHSRGAIMGLLLAATMPERVISAVLLDGVLPEAVPLSQAAQQLRQFLLDQRRLPKKPPPLYQSIDEAAQTRAKVSGTRLDTARILVERNLVPIEGGYTWGYDPRLRLPSAVKLSDEHMASLLTALEVPILVLLANDTKHRFFQAMLNRIAGFPIVEHQVFSGSHHFHMEEQAPELAHAAREFFNRQR